MQGMVAQPQQAHCHPSKTEVASNIFSGGIIYSKDILKIAVDALDAGECIFSKEQCPTQYHLSNEEEIKELLDEIPVGRSHSDVTRPVVLAKNQRSRKPRGTSPTNTSWCSLWSLSRQVIECIIKLGV
jgi:hypothetical protein